MDNLNILAIFILKNYTKNTEQDGVIGEYVFDSKTFEGTLYQDKVVRIAITINDSNKHFFEVYVGDMKYEFDTIIDCLALLYANLSKIKIEKKGLGLL